LAKSCGKGRKNSCPKRERVGVVFRSGARTSVHGSTERNDNTEVKDSLILSSMRRSALQERGGFPSLTKKKKKKKGGENRYILNRGVHGKKKHRGRKMGDSDFEMVRAAGRKDRGIL